ncbi:hypothetical protein ACH5RR_036932 [Cinchona calisaya]|uniref:DUF659 domain-containing protein n=1 Tax=Cinchona calisaya TaxID=153742 RepID=A0ABD2Y4Q1_9GENT
MDDFDGDDVQEIPPPRAKGISIDVVGASAGKGKRKAMTGPSYYALRVPLLQDAKTDVQLVIDSLRINWVQTRCTIMGDGWKDSRTNRKKSYNAVDYRSIDRIEFWEVEEEPNGKIDYKELEAKLENYWWMMILNVSILNKLKRKGSGLIDEDDE